MDLKEQLESNGFKLEIEDDGIFQQYVKIIGKEQVKRLVFAITPIQEVFIWIPEDHNSAEDDPLQDGVKIILDVDSVKKAILVTECIAGLDCDF